MEAVAPHYSLAGQRTEGKPAVHGGKPISFQATIACSTTGNVAPLPQERLPLSGRILNCSNGRQ